MISKDYYLNNFSEFIDLWQSTKSLDELIDGKGNFERPFWIDGIVKQDTIVDELKAWKKFYLNNYQKENPRDFKPYLTEGEIKELILNRLKLFKDGRLIQPQEAWEKIFMRATSKIRKLGRKEDMLRESIRLYNDLKRSPEFANLFELNELKNYMAEFSTKIEASNVLKLLKDSFPKNISDKNKQGKLLDFVFDIMTDYKLNDPEKDGIVYSSVGERLKARWREFVRKGIFKTDDPIKPSHIFDIAIDVFNDVKTSFIKNRSLFKFNFSSELYKALTKRIDPFNFKQNVRSLVRGFVKDSYRNGLRFVGLDPDDYKMFESIIVYRVNQFTNSFVEKLTKNVFSGVIDIGKAVNKGETWANRILSKAFELGRLTGDKNGLYKWVYGDTEHCATCAYADGQVHRLQEWWKAGIIPQNHGSKDLICGGYHCKCRLVRVTGRSKGRLDRIPVAS